MRQIKNWIFKAARFLKRKLTSLLASASSRQKDEYTARMHKEIQAYQQVENVANLPVIHGYWAYHYVLPLMEQFGFSNGEEFYFQYVSKYLANRGASPAKIITLGSGNCEVEVELAKKLVAAGFADFAIECTDLNPYMLERGRNWLPEKGLQSGWHFPRLTSISGSPPSRLAS